MTYIDYHSLIYYQKAKQLTKEVIALVDKLPNNRAFESIYKQIVRSCASIGANVAEGYGRNNPKEFRQFLGIARGSSFETEYWLEIIQESTNLKLTNLIELNKEVLRMLTVTIKNLRNPEP